MTVRPHSSRFSIFLGGCLWASLGTVSAETTFPLMTNCFDDGERVADVAASDPIRVRYASAAGGSKSCYAVQVIKGGRSLNGFLVGAMLPAIDRFEKDIRKHVPELQPARPPTPPAASAVAGKQAPKPEPPGPTSMAGLRAIDIYGRTVDLNEIQARNVVVYFWSASDKQSVRTAEGMEYISTQYRSTKKLEVVGIAKASNLEQLQRAVGEAEAVWPQVLDRGQIADRYHVNAAKPYVLLDRSRNVVATAASPKELEIELRKIGLK